MKKAAVIGAGFAGLAAAYFLSEKYQVTLFDQKGIGGGASGISSGLLHPYPGEKGRLSWHAEEALILAKKLIGEAEEALGQPVAHRGGILRLGPILNPGSDVVQLGPEKFLITSGMTVFPSLYLQGLWLVCKKRGVSFTVEKVESLETLKGYDSVVLAVGAGIRSFKEKEELKINFVKGQVLTCALQEPLERSISAKVYTALTESPLQCHVGATYERSPCRNPIPSGVGKAGQNSVNSLNREESPPFHGGVLQRDMIDEIPNRAQAIRLLNPTLPVLDCRAGIRVTNPAHYFPILQQIGPHHHVITALGSRGLLYHALMGSKLVF